MNYLQKIRHISRQGKIKLLLCLLLLFIILLIGSLLTIFTSLLKEAPETDFSSLKNSFAQTSTIYDSDDHSIQDVETLEARTNVSLDSIPIHVQNAFISIEDRKFFDHGGMDLRNILSSLKANIQAGQVVRGGSTISQQLIKNVYLSNERSLSRKLQEAYLTLRMEDEISKKEILEAYLNRIDLGFGSYGLQTASKNYFSKDCSQLTLAEGALLAGIVKSPAKYQPIHRIPFDELSLNGQHILATTEISGINMALVQNNQTFERQKIVLKAMEDSGYITHEERQKALEEKIVFKPYLPKESPYSSYATDYIKDEAAKELAKAYNLPLTKAKEKVATGGYKIYSSLDGDLQMKLEDLYRNFSTHVIQEAKDQGANFLSFDTDPYENILDSNGQVLFYKHSNLFDSEFNLKMDHSLFSFDKEGNLILRKTPFETTSNTLQIKDTYVINREGNLMTYDMGSIHLNSDEFKVKKSSIIIPKTIIKKYPNMFTRADNSLLISNEYLDNQHTPTLQPQSNSIIVENKTGYIVALVGGLDVDNPNKRILNRIYSQRQPGTSLVPFSVYLPALESGKTLGTIYDDVPQKTNDEIWPIQPRESYEGYMTLKRALELQKPSVATTILKELGFDASLTTLKSFGFYNSESDESDSIVTPKEDKERNDFTLDSLALGNLVNGVNTPILTQAYSSLSTDGKVPKNHIIRKILDPEGKIVINNEKLKSLNNISSENAFLMRNALMNSPFSKNLQSEMGIEAFAITGVNKFSSDYTIVGSIPKYSVGLWIGSDTPKLFLSNDKHIAEGFYSDIVDLLDLKGEFPKKPKSVYEIKISNKTGLLANSAARRNGTAEDIYYIKGSEPKKTTENYTRKLVCSVSNQLATRYCPHETIVARYYFVRPKGYDPSEFDNIYPKDYFSVPTTYCQVHTKDWYRQMMEEDKQDENEDEDKNNSNNKEDSNNKY